MRMIATCRLLACALALAACSKPQPPDTDRNKPDPQAGRAPRATQLRDAMQQPIDKARAVEQVNVDAAARQRREIDAQTSGE